MLPPSLAWVVWVAWVGLPCRSPTTVATIPQVASPITLPPPNPCRSQQLSTNLRLCLAPSAKSFDRARLCACSGSPRKRLNSSWPRPVCRSFVVVVVVVVLPSCRRHRLAVLIPLTSSICLHPFVLLSSICPPLLPPFPCPTSPAPAVRHHRHIVRVTRRLNRVVVTRFQLYQTEPHRLSKASPTARKQHFRRQTADVRRPTHKGKIHHPAISRSLIGKTARPPCRFSPRSSPALPFDSVVHSELRYPLFQLIVPLSLSLRFPLRSSPLSPLTLALFHANLSHTSLTSFSTSASLHRCIATSSHQHPSIASTGHQSSAPKQEASTSSALLLFPSPASLPADRLPSRITKPSDFAPSGFHLRPSPLFFPRLPTIAPDVSRACDHSPSLASHSLFSCPPSQPPLAAVAYPLASAAFNRSADTPYLLRILPHQLCRLCRISPGQPSQSPTTATTLGRSLLSPSFFVSSTLDHIFYPP